jgi:tRNA nucleotidyltransferase (CCA-adding enzyme)
MEKEPQVFIQVLRECGALKILMPEIDTLFGVPQPEAHHPEIDSGLHVLSVLHQAAIHQQPLSVRWACLLHDLGKGLTPEEEWPRHIAHEHKGLKADQGGEPALQGPKGLSGTGAVGGPISHPWAPGAGIEAVYPARFTAEL